MVFMNGLPVLYSVRSMIPCIAYRITFPMAWRQFLWLSDPRTQRNKVVWSACSGRTTSTHVTWPCRYAANMCNNATQEEIGLADGSVDPWHCSQLAPNGNSDPDSFDSWLVLHCRLYRRALKFTRWQPHRPHRTDLYAICGAMIALWGRVRAKNDCEKLLILGELEIRRWSPLTSTELLRKIWEY